MYSPKPSNESHKQTFTYFEYGLPILHPLSPFILDSPHTPDLFLERHPEHSSVDLIPSTDVQGGPSSDPDTSEWATGTPNHQHIGSADEDPAINTLGLESVTEPLTRQSFSGESPTTAAQDGGAENGSSYFQSNSAVTHLPPLQDVGAFHAHARIVEVTAPAMQRGISHRAEVMCTAETGDQNCDAPASVSQNSTVDLEFLSLSPLFSSQHDSGPLSPSWQLELELSSSWHLAAESIVSLSQPLAQGSSLVRRPATRRKGADYPNSPSIPIRKSPRLNRSRTSINSSRKRPSSESGILRATKSPMLKSHAYRVRFEEIETW